MNKKFNHDLWNKINSINLELVEKRLVAKCKFSAERAKEAVKEYREFLYLAATEGGIIPSIDVDEAWHAHILHLPAYVRDCMNTFGRMIWHVPNKDSVTKVVCSTQCNSPEIVTCSNNCKSEPCREPSDKMENLLEKKITFSIFVPVDEYEKNVSQSI
jgi:hypothetical protein